MTLQNFELFLIGLRIELFNKLFVHDLWTKSIFVFNWFVIWHTVLV